MTATQSFDDILVSLESLNEIQRDEILYLLDKKKVDRSRYFSGSKVGRWCFIIFSSAWLVALFSGGILDVSPLWFRILLLPLFGLPFIILHVYQIINYRAKKDFVEFLAVSIFIGPMLGALWGVSLYSFLYIIIFYVWKIITHLIA